jgi:hypothetical protein
MATGSNARPNPRAPDSHEYIAISREWIPTFEANDRITFYLGNPLSSIETRSAPALAHRHPRDFTFYLGNPLSSIETRSTPALAHRHPRDFTFYLGNPLSSILKILFILSKTLRDLCVLRGDVGIRNIRDIRG